MSQDGVLWSLDTTIPSDTEKGNRVVQEVVSQLESHGWGQHDIFGIHLSLQEAVINAIKHGNQYSGDKSVHVVCRLRPDQVHLEVADEGPGFKPAEVPDCTADENLDRPCGRGIMLMKSFMSHVDYIDAGNRVVMQKQKTEAA